MLAQPVPGTPRPYPGRRQGRRHRSRSPGDSNRRTLDTYWLNRSTPCCCMCRAPRRQLQRQGHRCHLRCRGGELPAINQLNDRTLGLPSRRKYRQEREELINLHTWTAINAGPAPHGVIVCRASVTGHAFVLRVTIVAVAAVMVVLALLGRVPAVAGAQAAA